MERIALQSCGYSLRILKRVTYFIRMIFDTGIYLTDTYLQLRITEIPVTPVLNTVKH